MILQYHCKEAYDDRKQGSTFYKGRSQDHVCTNVIRCFWLTGNRFNSAFTDLTDTDTGTDSSKTCTNCTTCIAQLLLKGINPCYYY